MFWWWTILKQLLCHTASLFLYHCQLYLVTRNPYLPIICCSGHEIYMIYYIHSQENIQQCRYKISEIIMIALIHRQLGDRFTYFLSPKYQNTHTFFHVHFIHISTNIHSLKHTKLNKSTCLTLYKQSREKYFRFIKIPTFCQTITCSTLFYVYSTQDEQW